MKNRLLKILSLFVSPQLLAIIGIFFSFNLLAQVPEGFNEFRYPSGKISSEGFMKGGRPEGYWKTYHENGNIKSEGNRLNHKLDSIWKFYDSDGILSTSINYSFGKKNGWQKSFNKNSTVVKEELFKKDTIQYLKKYYQSGNLKLQVPFVDGLKHGNAFEFDTSGTLQIGWWKYIENEANKIVINRYDALGKKTGKWIVFENEVLRKESNFSRGLKNGVERIYDKKGRLKEINKYSNGKLLKDVKELQKVKIKKEIGVTGLISKSGGFNEKGQPHGIHRKYNEAGEVSSSKVFKNGILKGEGIVKKNGNKDGEWINYYLSGKKLSQGKFKNGKKIGEWKYFFENGLVESEGYYANNGKQDGLWKEYFESGNIREEVNYYEGLYDGSFRLFNDSGEVLILGKFKEDYEDSVWTYLNGDYSEKGEYKEGMKVGEWRGHFSKEQLVFRGSFENGIPVGEHLFWYESGSIKMFGKYRVGRKTGDWIHYTEGGKILMLTRYEDGLAKTYNGYEISPAHEPDDYIEYNETGYE